MDYSTILSGLENNLSGVGGIAVMAVAGVLAIVILHFTRMSSSRSSAGSRNKSYQHTVIAPYLDDADKDPEKAMSAKFSDAQS